MKHFSKPAPGRQLFPMIVARRKFGQGSLILALTSVFVGCTAHKQPSRVETTLANMAKDVVIPIEAESKKNPLPETEEVVKQGQQVFLGSCALCHGTDGHGHTDLGRNMYPPAMDMTSPHVQHWSDAELFWIIQNGVRLTGMPAWKSNISESDTWKLIRFVHSLPRLDAVAVASKQVQVQPPNRPVAELVKYGRTLYRQEGCFMCHQLDGEGGKVGPNLSVERTRRRTDQWLIGHFKDPAAYTPGSIMPSFKNLTDEQLQALTVFLQAQEGSAR